MCHIYIQIYKITCNNTYQTIIDSEIFLFDKNKPYIIIKFIKGIKKYKDMDYEFGPILKNNNEYKKYLINKYNKIINNISKKKIFIRLKYRLLILKIKFL